MKFILGLVLLCAVGAGAACAADFYPSGAKFIFDAATNDAGEFEFEVPAVFSNITDWRTTPAVRPGWVPESLRNLDAEIKSGRKKLSELDAKIASLNQTVGLLAKAQTGNSTFDNLLDYAKDAEEMALNALNEISTLTLERDELKTRIDYLAQSFAEKMPPNAQRSLKITGTGDKNASVKIEAFTDIASWTPRQRMKLDSQTGKISAEMFADVSQKTGLDVEGELRFHTNMPQQARDLPELSPKIVDIMPPRPVPMARNAAPSSKMMMEADMIGSAEYSMPMMAPQITSGLAAMTISARGKIPGDGVIVEVPLGRYEINSEVSLICVPEYGDAVYVVAETEPLKQPLVGGAGYLYIDGQASASPYLKTFGEGERAKITFGTSPLVKVVRKDIVSKTDTSWWGTSGKLNDGYTIEIKNGMPSEQKITVKDRIPISASGKIAVADIKIAPAPADKNNENILTWVLTLKSGESAAISVNYTLEFPASENLMFR